MREPRFIKLLDPPHHISEVLTHWTGRSKSDNEAFSIIQTIIESSSLKLSVCPHGFTSEDGAEHKGTMVCFTETPIEHSLLHCKLFGKFGIGFDKKAMMRIGANPVLYIVPERKEFQNKFFQYYWEGLQELYGSQMNVPFETRNMISWFSSMTQPYVDKVKNKWRDYYPQREWRIIRILPTGITDAELKKWGPINDGFNIDEIKCHFEEQNIKNVRQMQQVCFLEFKKSDIRQIIVPKKFKLKAKNLRIDNKLNNCDILILPD